MNNKSGKRTIDASPTKDFFISIFIKDIDLKRSIVDLVDNCVDGAVRIRPDGNFNELKVKITVNQDKFEISDNCGGISIETAANYAFRFGRDDNAPQTPHSIGLFGVGMKRAIFKMGRKFRVESTTQTSYFEIEEDIEEWKAKKDKNGKDSWEFNFETIKDDEGFGEDTQGTIITVTSLHDSIGDDFDSDSFITELADEIQKAHLYNLGKGLTITLNGNVLKTKPIMLLHSDEIKPAYKERTIINKGVQVRLYTGIFEDGKPKDAGWYIFCNNRLVLGANRDFVTGWGSGVPQYHNDYARFRGYVFFESENPKLLPWNTTKTGIDTDSASFRAIRNDMINMMKPVITFLREFRKEKSNENLDDRPLESSIAATQSAKLANIEAATIFSYPTPRKVKRTKANSRVIQYRKSLEQINRVQQELGVSTLKETGEATFEYFLRKECSD